MGFVGLSGRGFRLNLGRFVAMDEGGFWVEWVIIVQGSGFVGIFVHFLAMCPLSPQFKHLMMSLEINTR